MKKILLVLLLSIILCGCNKEEDVYSIMEKNDHVIIDVRTKEEYDYLHVIDSINIPVNEINENVDIDKDKIIFVYCQSGNRSKTAYNILTELGYTVYDLGGINQVELEKE